MKIRALALPAALMNYVIIGFSLGIQEVLAPIFLISVSLVVNVYGDFALVPTQGLVGAAISSYYCLILLWYDSWINKIDVFISCKYFLKVGNEASNNKSSNPITNLFTWFGRLRSQVVPLLSTSSALFAGKFTDSLTYSAGAQITTFIAAGLQTNHSAAHQVIMQMWWFSFISNHSSCYGLSINITTGFCSRKNTKM